MKKFLFAFLIFATPALADWPVAEMNKMIDQTNFVVNEGCSGTLIDLKNRLVLTANHCVTDQYQVVEKEEIDEDGEVTKKKVRHIKPGTVKQIDFAGSDSVREVTYRTKLLGNNKDVDLALLQINADIPNTIAAPIACKPPCVVTRSTWSATRSASSTRA
jgi:S1-C subfamily serine protease